MKFEYYDKDFGRQVSRANISYWVRTTGKMREDLSRFAAGDVTESEAREYLADMTGYLRKPRNICGGVLYLMYDEPSEMPADARVEFVYTPTYLAAAIAMTAMNRFESLMEDAGLCRAIRALLCGATGRRFQGAGYDGDIGLMDALDIFGEGDTMDFIGKNPDFCPEFTVRFREAVEYLQNEICTGKVTNAWTGKDYAQRGKTVLAKLLGEKVAVEYVWYACYGSNLLRGRFLEYIAACGNCAAPVEDRPFEFSHNIRFAKSSGRWQGGGVAFLDSEKPGHAYGRIYKITREQFEQIKMMEGPNYQKELLLGDVDRLPVYSFTDHKEDTPVRMPSEAYFRVILAGLKECWGSLVDAAKLHRYLVEAIMPADMFLAAAAIRENDHYLTNGEISRRTGMSLGNTAKAVEWLAEHGVIRQDTRSVNSGHIISDPDAFFYTCEGDCARGLISEMIRSRP